MCIILYIEFLVSIILHKLGIQNGKSEEVFCERHSFVILQVTTKTPPTIGDDGFSMFSRRAL